MHLQTTAKPNWPLALSVKWYATKLNQQLAFENLFEKPAEEGKSLNPYVFTFSFSYFSFLLPNN